MTAMQDRIEIRMFGRLFVRRSDGEVVDADAWSTGKNTDLLRLLALSGNRPVSVQSLINNLWPDVDDDKAKASLRTAASRIRQVLGDQCVERSLGGLILHNSWTDVVSFQTIVHDVSTAMRDGDHARVVSRAREAEALYIADFGAYDDKSSWATETRESLRLSRQSLLADAGEAALKLMWMRDAIDFSTLAISVDPSFERPHRTLMRAHAALGEVELALRAFEHCRVCLSQELGADPSPQTSALHLQILAGHIEEPTVKAFVGRADEVLVLAGILRVATDHDGCDVVCLAGPVGSGRGALLDATAAEVSDARVQARFQDRTSSSDALTLAGMTSERRSDITVWGPADDDPSWEVVRLLTFLSKLDPDVSRVIVVVTSAEAAALVGQILDTKSPMALSTHTTGEISATDMESLAGAALSGRATERLLHELGIQSHHLAGRAVLILRDWMAAGWIISTMDGLDLYNDGPALTGESPVGDYFRITLEHLTWAEREFCHLIALVNRPVTADFLQTLDHTGANRDELQAKLDELADLGVLSIGLDGYTFRNRAIRDAFENHMRPAVKARKQRGIRSDLGDTRLGQT